MNIEEVYALNIQPRQFIKDLRVSLEDIGIEREKFILWMRETEKRFLSQMDAWDTYIAPLNLALYEIEYMNDKEDDEIELDAILNRSLYGWHE